MCRISKEETGKKIRKLMAEYGVTVREIQEEMELESPQAVYKWLNGKALPSTENLLILGRLLHVPMETMLVTEEDPERRREWEKNHPKVFMAHLVWGANPVHQADARRLSRYFEYPAEERLLTVSLAN